MASLTQWTWVLVNSGSWWWTGRPGVVQSMGLQRVGHDWAAELNWTDNRDNDSALSLCSCEYYCGPRQVIGTESGTRKAITTVLIEWLCGENFACIIQPLTSPDFTENDGNLWVTEQKESTITVDGFWPTVCAAVVRSNITLRIMGGWYSFAAMATQVFLMSYLIISQVMLYIIKIA